MSGSDYLLAPIGVVRSAVRTRKQMPPFGAPAAIELFAQFEPALLRIEKHSHFWVLAWLMEGAERELLQVTPRGVDPQAVDALHGVFSVRSPARPNPIGLTAARLLKREGTTLHFDRLDFIDGTEVLDLKPYFVSHDLIFCASSAPIGRPASREALRESLTAQALHWVPELHPDVALAVRIVEHFRSEFLHWQEPERWRVRAPRTAPHLTDALMGITRVSFSRGLELDEDSRQVVLNGACYRIHWRRQSWDDVMAAADSELFAVSRVDA